jgi:uncharacterized protein (DUF1697 family)
MNIYVALLRAINVGGTGKLPMKEFKTACRAADLIHVSTYITSLAATRCLRASDRRSG